jgi:hypothetical protein
LRVKLTRRDWIIDSPFRSVFIGHVNVLILVLLAGVSVLGFVLAFRSMPSTTAILAFLSILIAIWRWRVHRANRPPFGPSRGPYRPRPGPNGPAGRPVRATPPKVLVGADRKATPISE